MKSTYPLAFYREHFPELQSCPECGHPSGIFFESDPSAISPGPRVYVHCPSCQFTISSEQLLGDFSGAPVLEKCRRVIHLWNQWAQCREAESYTKTHKSIIQTWKVRQFTMVNLQKPTEISDSADGTNKSLHRAGENEIDDR